jgi:hypothetical protein
LGLLEREAARLRALINVDEQAAKAFKRLSEKISRDDAALSKLEREIALASQADARIKELVEERRTSYGAIFDGIFEEEKELTALYEPLRERLAAEDGALGKLTFSIRRSVDVAAWVQRGEDLLDLRRAGPFKGRGALLTAARTHLLPAWESGSSAEVAEAMAVFRATHESQLLEHAPVERTDDDHVNGVERLLRTRSVRCLALPYMDIGQRLQQASSVSSDPCSASTALLQLDPVQWLTSQGLSDKVETVLMIRGGARGDNDPPVDVDPQPLPGSPSRDERFQPGAVGNDDEQLRREYRTVPQQTGFAGPRLALWKHAFPSAAARFPIELMFFNSEQPDLFRVNATGDRVARRSGASLKVLQIEVSVVMRRYGLEDLSKPPRRGWRQELRRIYERHFGRSGLARNNISLCLLVRPLAPEVEPCSLFDGGGSLLPYPMDRAGLLCLGDLQVDHLLGRCAFWVCCLAWEACWWWS